MAKKQKNIVTKKTGLSSRAITLFYIILFFIGVCITAFIVYKDSSTLLLNSTLDQHPTSIPKTESTQKLEGAELSQIIHGWRYTDPKQGFEVTFPLNWKSEKICTNGLSNDSYLCLQSPSLTVSPVPHVVSGELITIGPKGSGSFAATSTSLKVFCNSDDRIKIRSCESTQYNGIPAVKKIWDSYPVIDVAILKENEIKYVIRLQYAYELLHSSHEFTDFDTIVSSFKLIE